jgi:hypothetical protein
VDSGGLDKKIKNTDGNADGWTRNDFTLEVNSIANLRPKIDIQADTEANNDFE